MWFLALMEESLSEFIYVINLQRMNIHSFVLSQGKLKFISCLQTGAQDWLEYGMKRVALVNLFASKLNGKCPLVIIINLLKNVLIYIPL